MSQANVLSNMYVPLLKEKKKYEPEKENAIKKKSSSGCSIYNRRHSKIQLKVQDSRIADSVLRLSFLTLIIM